MSRRKIRIPAPLDLIFMLIDSCMPRLSPNAWKVVCYVAGQHLRVHEELLYRDRSPGLYHLANDLFAAAGIVDAPQSTERPYRSDDRAPAMPGEKRGRFTMISLHDLGQGARLKNPRRWRDYGTGLSKSSLAVAIREAVQSGILVHERRKSAGGRDLASYYSIDWDRVQEYDWQRRRNRSMRKRF